MDIPFHLEDRPRATATIVIDPVMEERARLEVRTATMPSAQVGQGKDLTLILQPWIYYLRGDLKSGDKLLKELDPLQLLGKEENNAAENR